MKSICVLEGKTINTQVCGLNINYIDEGKGPVILMLHGWGSCAENFRAIINPLCDHFRIISPDFPGCGNSDILKTPWTLEDYSCFVAEFLRVLDLDPQIIFGHSHGGRTACYLASKGILKPNKIVLFGSAGIVSKKSLYKRCLIATFKTAKFFLTLPFIRNYSQRTLNNVRAYFGSSDYNAAPEVMRNTLVNLVNCDISEMLPLIKIPTLLVWGEKDIETPLEMGKKMELLIPDSGLCIIKDAGHFAFAQKPYEVSAILNSFLN